MSGNESLLNHEKGFTIIPGHQLACINYARPPGHAGKRSMQHLPETFFLSKRFVTTEIADTRGREGWKEVVLKGVNDVYQIFVLG